LYSSIALLSPPCASLCLQGALQALHHSQSPACARLCDALIGLLAPPDHAPGESPLVAALEDPERGRIMEAVLSVAPPPRLWELFREQLKGRLVGVACHRLANHGLQRLLDHAPSDLVGGASFRGAGLKRADAAHWWPLWGPIGSHWWPFWDPFGVPLVVPFGSHWWPFRCPFWVPFRSYWDRLGSLFGFHWGTFLCPIWVPLVVSFGSHWGSFWDPIWVPLVAPLRSRLEPIGGPIWVLLVTFLGSHLEPIGGFI
ncbi:hypothetical protein CIB84_017615, partial [Bambusicola thoracicus]